MHLHFFCDVQGTLPQMAPLPSTPDVAADHGETSNHCLRVCCNAKSCCAMPVLVSAPICSALCCHTKLLQQCAYAALCWLNAGFSPQNMLGVVSFFTSTVKEAIKTVKEVLDVVRIHAHSNFLIGSSVKPLFQVHAQSWLQSRISHAC